VLYPLVYWTFDKLVIHLIIMDKNNNRPRYLNLIKIAMPVTAIVSIAHRASGLLLVLSIPFLIYAFQASVSSAAEFNSVLNTLQQPWFKAILIILTWSFTHHFFAGIRFLLIDIDWGVTRSAARASAWFVHVIAITVTLIVAGMLL